MKHSLTLNAFILSTACLSVTALADDQVQAIAIAWGINDPDCKIATAIAIMEACDTAPAIGHVTSVTNCNKKVGPDIPPGLGQWMTKCPMPPGNDGYRAAFIAKGLYNTPNGCLATCQGVSKSNPGTTCNLYDTNNAAQAAHIYHDVMGGFTPWVTYNSGVYKRALSYAAKYCNK